MKRLYEAQAEAQADYLGNIIRLMQEQCQWNREPDDQELQEFCIDLCSFNVEARDPDEAYAKAREMIRRGDAEIDQVVPFASLS